jgi:hypothetical protein
VEREHAGAERIDGLWRCGLGERRWQQRLRELLGRQIGQYERLLQALLGDVGWQRAAPPGIGRRLDKAGQAVGVAGHAKRRWRIR